MKVVDIKVYDNFDVTFRLVICKTRKEMHRVIKNDDKKANSDCDTTGYFASTDQLEDDNLPGRFISNVIGKVYLNLDDLQKDGDKIIVHECGHIALTYEHDIKRYTGNFTDGKTHGEYFANGEGNEQEVFCYFLEFAFEKIQQAVNDYKKGMK